MLPAVADFQFNCRLLAFSIAAFRSGAVMGFLLAGNGLLVVFLTIMAYKKVSFACSASNLPCMIGEYTVK